MNVEFSVTSETAKTRAIEALRGRGFQAGTGSVRLAYPFSVMVEGLREADLDAISRCVKAVDPCAGTIVTALEPARVPARLTR